MGPRTRNHLFAHVKFKTETDLESWKETFPDPSTSPAHYAKTLTINCPRAVTAADAEPGGWIGTFSHVVDLQVDSQRTYTYADEAGVSLLPLVEQTRGQRQTGRNDLPGRVRELLNGW